MHILIIPSEHFVVEKSPLSGIFQYEQARALSAAGNQVGVISVGFISLRYLFQRYPYHKYEKIGAVNIYRSYRRSLLVERFVDAPLASRRYLNIFKMSYRKYALKYGPPDVVHAHNFLYAGVVAKYLKEELGIPFVLTEHSSAFARGMVSDVNNIIIQSICAEAGALSCVSASLKTTLDKRFKQSFAVLPNMVDSMFFVDTEGRPAEGLFTFINVASLDENKNQALLLRAFALRFKNCPAQLRIAGDGPLRVSLERLAQELGISDQVVFIGRLPRSAVHNEMRKSNCFVLSSNYETFGVVLIEALASGLPLIATKCGGPEGILNPGNGILVDIGAEHQLAKAMQEIYLNYSVYRRDKLSAEARNCFGEQAFVGNAMALYEKALENDRNH